MATIREDLVGVIHADGHVLKAGDEVPEGVVVGDHALAAPAEASTETSKPYSEWRRDDLEAEVKRRNDARDDDLIKVEEPGNKAEIAAALAADDGK